MRCAGPTAKDQPRCCGSVVGDLVLCCAVLHLCLAMALDGHGVQVSLEEGGKGDPMSVCAVPAGTKKASISAFLLSPTVFPKSSLMFSSNTTSCRATQCNQWALLIYSALSLRALSGRYRLKLISRPNILA